MNKNIAIGLNNKNEKCKALNISYLIQNKLKLIYKYIEDYTL